DMAFLRRKGMQCYGIGPATDSEDGPKGFGAHSDQERILESELYRFVRFNWAAVVNIPKASWFLPPVHHDGSSRRFITTVQHGGSTRRFGPQGLAFAMLGVCGWLRTSANW